MIVMIVIMVTIVMIVIMVTTITIVVMVTIVLKGVELKVPVEVPS